MVTRDEILLLAKRAEAAGQKRLATKLFALGGLLDGRTDDIPRSSPWEPCSMTDSEAIDHGVKVANSLLLIDGKH